MENSKETMIVGRTKCGKTTFVQNQGKNKFFGDISTVFWMSKISLSEEREEKVRESLRIKKFFLTTLKIWAILIIY